MLAAALVDLLGDSATALGREELDVTSREQVHERVAELRPDVILHCAAWTDVDGAQSQPEATVLVNRDAIGFVLEAADAIGVRVVYFSTDYVFAGTEPRRLHAPFDDIEPSSVYARSKAEGEAYVRGSIARGAQHLIVRTSWLYGAGGSNFVDTMVRLGREREALRVVDDQWGRPTWTRDLARAAIDLLHAADPGVYHVAGGGVVTWRDFAEEIVRSTGGGAAVEGVSTEEWGAPAPRPRHSVLDLSTTEAALGRRLPHWRSSLSVYLTGGHRNG